MHTISPCGNAERSFVSVCLVCLPVSVYDTSECTQQGEELWREEQELNGRLAGIMSVRLRCFQMTRGWSTLTFVWDISLSPSRVTHLKHSKEEPIALIVHLEEITSPS